MTLPAAFSKVCLAVNQPSDDVPARHIAVALARSLGVELDFARVTEEDGGPHHLVVTSSRSAESMVAASAASSSNGIEQALQSEIRRDPSVLWCVPSHAKMALPEAVLGSISEQLVRDLDVPVILIGPHATREVGTANVLVAAVDGTEHAEKILPVASRMAADLGMQLRLVQVLNPDLVPAGGVAQESNYLRHLAADRKFSTTNEPVDFDVLHGTHPEDAITDYIEAYPEVGLLAMATRGVPPRARMVHPSVTYRVLRRVVCPIVVLHPPDLL